MNGVRGRIINASVNRSNVKAYFGNDSITHLLFFYGKYYFLFKFARICVVKVIFEGN